MAGGRPTDYDPKYCEMLVDHMKTGMSFPSFASIIDKNPDTLYEWAKSHPEFSDAKKRGEAHALAYFERMGLLGMSGKLRGFNFGAWIANMNNKFRAQGWRRGDFAASDPVEQGDPLADALAVLDEQTKQSDKPPVKAGKAKKSRAKTKPDVKAPKGNPPKLRNRKTAKAKKSAPAKASSDVRPRPEAI